MHLQLFGSYPVLLLAVGRVRSERISRWLLGYVTVQVAFTFIACYELPRTLASVLEKQVPYVALTQLAGAVMVLAAAQWYDRRTITLQNLVIGFLIALNVSTLLLLQVLRSKLEDARDLQITVASERAIHDAEVEFNAGRLRQLEVYTIVAPESARQSAFTGRTNGPFEIRSLPRWQREEDESFWLRYSSEYVRTYNARMAFLYRWSKAPGPAQDATNDP